MNDQPGALRIAVAVVALQAAALVGLAGFVLIDGLTGHADRLARGLLGGAFALLAAVVLALGARGLHRLSPGARTPVMVLELLALPVSYDIAFPSHRPAIGGPMLISALAVLYCLFTPGTREFFERTPRA